MFARIENNEATEFPLDLRQAYPLVSWPADLENAELPAGVVRVIDAAIPETSYADVLDAGAALEDGQWVRSWQIVPWPIETVRDVLTRSITSKRWRVETGGITLPDGTKVATALDDQNRVSNAILNGQRVGLTQVDFKGVDGWVVLSMDTLVFIADAMALHVQACFTAEKNHHNAVMQCTYEELLAYDLEAGWPPND